MKLRPTRICHLGKYYPPASGGMELHVRLLARGQAELGAQVRVICVNHVGEAGRDVTWDVIHRTPFVEEADGPVRVTRMGRCASIMRFDICPGLPALFREFEHNEVDVLHLHAPNPSMVLALNVWAQSIPLVVTHHSDVIRQKFLGLSFRAFERRVYGRAAAIFQTSPKYSDGSPSLRRFEDRVRPLPLGIELEPFLNPSAASLHLAGDWKSRFGDPIWLCVGRLVYYKGLENAIRALALVPGQLILIGTGPQERVLKNLATDIGVADRVVWCGAVDDATLAGAYRAATALWFPSNARSEGFGLVQVEAMASGCPVINTDVPHSGVSWVCRHEKEGLTVAVNDHVALAAAANRLLHEPRLRERLATAGRDRALNEFDFRAMAARSLEFYAEALGGGRLGLGAHDGVIANPVRP